jgi:hypothetical protein
MPRQFSTTILIACLVAVCRAAAVEPLPDEGPAKIFVDPPLPEPLSQGRVVIPYRTENLHIAPVFGPAAVATSPRVGHLHVRVDDAPWVWAHLSDAPVILNGLPPGSHKVLLQLENANHQLLDQGDVQFTVPDSPRRASAPAVQEPRDEAAARLIVEAPRPEPLSRGVVFLEYRAEPRIGHVHVTIDDTPWRWEDASGRPVIILGLPAGRRRIRLELLNADHQSTGQATVDVTVPDVHRMEHP